MKARKRRKDNTTVVGLDVGTTKVCVTVGEVAREGMNLRAVSVQPSSGMRKGSIVDIEAASRSIREVADAVKRQIGLVADRVIVGLGGKDLRGSSSTGTIAVQGDKVTHEDVERAVDVAGASYIPLDREILHVVPTGFTLDGQKGISNPVGMPGVKLEADVYMVTAALTSVQNMVTCCEKAGLVVADFVVRASASADATLTSDERDLGVVLVDIGGGTTDIAVYKDGGLRHVAVFPVGGGHFTNDLSIGLRLPHDEAERIKTSFGSLVPLETNDAGEIEIISVDGQARGIPRKYVLEIIQPRAEELLGLIGEEIQRSAARGIPTSSIVLTGGASLLKGFDRLAEALLSMPVRIGYPRVQQSNFGENSSVKQSRQSTMDFRSPLCATGIGLLLHGADSVCSPAPEVSPSPRARGIGTAMRDFLGNILRRKRGDYV